MLCQALALVSIQDYVLLQHLSVMLLLPFLQHLCLLPHVILHLIVSPHFQIFLVLSVVLFSAIVILVQSFLLHLLCFELLIFKWTSSCPSITYFIMFTVSMYSLVRMANYCSDSYYFSEGIYSSRISVFSLPLSFSCIWSCHSSFWCLRRNTSKF